MDLNDTPELAEYRAKARAWLQEHAAEAPQRRGREDLESVSAHREWQRKLAEAGLAAVTWPAEYGGQGLGPLHQVVLNQEISHAGVAGLFDVIGVGMLGPTLIAHGTEEQKQRHLGSMLAADEVWCQLFSEPAAGSDLAGIQTRARREDDGSWRVSGQKVWTTNAQHASFGLLLARTDPGVPKHKGLTMFVLPMDAEGVSVRPLRQISGDAHFNEVFLDDVRLEDEATVGPVDGGWGVAMTTLMFERVAIGLGGEGFGWRADRFATALIEDEPATRDREVRHRFGAIAAEFLALRFTSYRMLTMLQEGQIPGPEAALAKVTTVRAAIAAGDLLIDVLGPGALEDERAGRLVSDMPGIKSAGGTEEILRSMVGERVLGLPPEPRLDKGVPFAELRARERGGGGMNFALTDEQELLTEAARGALSRVKTVEAAREALDGAALPDLWPTAVEAGWTGMLVSEDQGGAGLGAMDAMLVSAELGRVLASVPLLGHLPATLLLDSDERRACFVPAKPPSAVEEAWTVDPRAGLLRAPAPVLTGEAVTGEVAWVPDAPGAEVLVVVCSGGEVVAVDAGDASVEPVEGYDATRSLGHVSLDGAACTPVEGDAAAAWYLAQCLLAAEAVGAIERALEVSVAYAKERYTFGRAIGSYQAIKHELVEILRRLENARSLMFYAGWAAADKPEELAVAASAFRLVASEGYDQASRAQISVHGGIGATWEHDAPLYYRRAQLDKRLLAGAAGAADRVADELFAQARAAV